MCWCLWRGRTAHSRPTCAGRSHVHRHHAFARTQTICSLALGSRSYTHTQPLNRQRVSGGRHALLIRMRKSRRRRRRHVVDVNTRASSAYLLLSERRGARFQFNSRGDRHTDTQTHTHVKRMYVMRLASVHLWFWGPRVVCACVYLSTGNRHTHKPRRTPADATTRRQRRCG